MTKSVKITIAVLLLLCVIIAVFPLMSIKDSEFGGADGAAEEAISEIDPGYEPWAESILEPPGGETESLLFCLPERNIKRISSVSFGRRAISPF